MTTSTLLTPAQRATHTYVLGQPGTGKSRALETWIMQDIAAGHGVGVVDPHGELFHNLVLRLSLNPDTWDRVIIIDPSNPRWIVGFNPLEAINGQPGERVALFMTDIIMKIWGLNASNAPRSLWLLTNTFLALSVLGLSILDLPRFLTDKAFRDALVPRIRNQNVQRYFQYEFPKQDAAIHSWVTPVLNKIGGLIFDPEIACMFATGKGLEFGSIMDERKILLVNIPKGIIGEGPSALLGAFLVARIQKAALARTSRRSRPPFYLYLDEFQNYTSDNITDILAESRKYALSLILAHQYLSQLPTEIKNAVINTAGTIAAFRSSYQDAYQLAKEIFPPESQKQDEPPAMNIGLGGVWPTISLAQPKKTLTWDERAREITSLDHRQFWLKVRGNSRPRKYRSYNMPDVRETKAVISNMTALINRSGKRNGRWKPDVLNEIALNTSQTKKHHSPDSPSDKPPQRGIWST